ncbi:MAG: pyridoxamine 5'-phosphate oxidase family protein [Actinomycetales bacterium]
MPDPISDMPAMTGYGVGGDTWEPLPWSWAAQRLRDSRNYWLVTVSPDAAPHTLPVWGVWHDDEHRFCFSCAPNARKARNLAGNPQVAVTPESTVEALSVNGTAHTVVGARREEWIERYLAKYLPLSPDLTADFLRENACYEVIPVRAIAVIEREDEFATRATRWRFDGRGSLPDS